MLLKTAVQKLSKITLQLLICGLCKSASWPSVCDICNVGLQVPFFIYLFFFVENFATPSRKDSSEMAISQYW